MSVFSKIRAFFDKKKIYNDDPQEIASASINAEQIDESYEIMQSFIDHLNEIEKWKDRIESLKWLANDAKQSAGNPEYEIDTEQLRNMSVSLGGRSDVIDFAMFQKCMNLTLEWYDKLALQAVSSGNL